MGRERELAALEGVRPSDRRGALLPQRGDRRRRDRESPGSPRSWLPGRQRASPCCAGAARATARGSRSGRSRRCSEAGGIADDDAPPTPVAKLARVARRRQTMPRDRRPTLRSPRVLGAVPPHRRRPSGPSRATSRRWRRPVRCSSSSTTSTGLSPRFLDLIEYLEDRDAVAPILIAAFAHPELREVAVISSGGTRSSCSRLTKASGRLIETRLGGGDLPATVVAGLVKPRRATPCSSRRCCECSSTTASSSGRTAAGGW